MEAFVLDVKTAGYVETDSCFPLHSGLDLEKGPYIVYYALLLLEAFDSDVLLYLFCVQDLVTELLPVGEASVAHFLIFHSGRYSKVDQVRYHPCVALDLKTLCLQLLETWLGVLY